MKLKAAIGLDHQPLPCSLCGRKPAFWRYLGKDPVARCGICGKGMSRSRFMPMKDEKE